MKQTMLTSFFILSLFLSQAFAQESKPVNIFAAASTTNAITDIGKLYTGKKMGTIRPSFASSSTLAKQIDQGAPASIYLSANPKWMNFLEKKGFIKKGTRSNLLGNRCVIIAPADSSIKFDIKPGFDLAKLLGDGKLAMGDPDHVPAGIYGKQALESLGAWETVSPKVARSKDVRAALVLVERGEAPLGIVYATDAAISKKVKIVGVFPENTHPPITYPVAIISENMAPEAISFS